MNTLSRLSIFGAVFFIAGAILLAGIVVRSPYVTAAGVVQVQPVPFSHEHHVGRVGLDCRYCHWTVEDGASAGMPSTEVCLNCHTHLFADSPMLAPVLASARNSEPLQWSRVHDLPDFAFFDHSIHVQKGVGCESCHGRVDRMPLMWRASTLHMEWCLDCHRHPEPHLRRREDVFQFGWTAPAETPDLGEQLREEYNVSSKTDCSSCHR